MSATLLVLRCLLSHWRRHVLQGVICLLGIALGVAVVTAMDLANASALRSFRTSIQEVAGKATHQIAPDDTGASIGVPDELFAAIWKQPGVIAAMPVVEAHGLIGRDAPGAHLPSETPATVATVRVLGIDPLLATPFRTSERLALTSGQAFNDWLLRDDGAVIHERLAARFQLSVGDTFALTASGRRHTLRLIATFAPDDGSSGGEDLLLMDIAAAQERFGVAGAISHIDLILPDGPAGDSAAESLRTRLPKGCVIQKPSERAGRTEGLLDAFQLNLRALSLLALIVGIFLVHNTLTVAVLQRLPIVGTLRCLGASSADIRRAVLIEALGLGVIGSALGLLLGAALAGIFLQRVGGIVSDLYAHVGALSVFYDSTALIKGALLGVVAAVAGAYFPAREAGSVSPSNVLRRSRVERKSERSWKGLALGGIASLVATAGLAVAPGSSPIPGLAAAFALALSGALFSPAAVRGFSRISAGVLRRVAGTEGFLAARGIGANLSRTGLAVGALSLSLSMTLGVALMISSFRSTLEVWMSQALHADYYMRPAGPSLMRHKAFLPEETLATLRAWPTVDAIDTYRGRDILLPDGSLILAVATETRATFRRGLERFPFKVGDPKTVAAALLQGEVTVSEPLARKQNLSLGGTIRLPARDGVTELRIAGIYYEYATDRGVVSMDVSLYERLFGDARANSVSVYLKPDADLAAEGEKLQRLIADPGALYFFSNRSLRAEAFKVFDRTFAITRQLETLSLAVGLCGILSALLALLRERSTDFALMRALGMPASWLLKLVVIEGLLLGLVAFLVACVMGPALSLLLIHVINVRAFGWTIFFAFDGGVFLRVGAWVLVMSAAAAIYPSLRARTLQISAALRDE